MFHQSTLLQEIIGHFSHFFDGSFDNVKMDMTMMKIFFLPMWCKYVRFHIMSRWGTEDHCAVSQVGVHGNSLMDDLVSWDQSLFHHLFLFLFAVFISLSFVF